MKHILIGSHDTERQNRDHIRSLARGIRDYVVAETIEVAEGLIKTFKEKGEEYFAIFNMNVLGEKGVRECELVRVLSEERRALLSYNHRLPKAA